MFYKYIDNINNYGKHSHHIYVIWKTEHLGKIVFQISFLYANSIPLSSFLSPQDVEHLRIGQRRLIEMLRVFDEICINNSVEYVVIGGTLLGAFAYQRWIPWDGDIDVEILKSDWSKLEQLLMSRLPKNMWLQIEKTDKHYRS